MARSVGTQNQIKAGPHRVNSLEGEPNKKDAEAKKEKGQHEEKTKLGPVKNGLVANETSRATHQRLEGAAQGKKSRKILKFT